nr:TctD-like protein [Rhodomonas sp. NIES-1730]
MLKSKTLTSNIQARVLLLDDEVNLLFALSNYLESRGFLVMTATSSQEAIKLLQHNIPDLFIIDVMMPHQNGYEFILEVKKTALFSSTPFIFLTAKGMKKDRIKGYEMGCRAYITKPFDPEELLIIINNIFFETKDITNIKKISGEIRKIRLTLENKNMNYIKLTPKEKQILLEILKGKSNETIGKYMKTSTRNIEKHITRILSKTKNKNRIGLIKFAYKFYGTLT